MKIVLTGKMSERRALLTINWKCIEVQWCVSSETDFLVTGTMMGDTKKYKSALTRGTKIVTEKQFKEILLNDYPEYLL